MTDVEIRNTVQDGEIWLNARDVVRALRDRSERWDLMALEPEDGDETPPEQRQTACWAASAALERSADEIDVACMDRINQTREGTR